MWGRRPKTSNSRDYFETPDAFRRMFLLDWSLAKESHGLERYIQKSGQADPDEVAHVREVLWKHARTIYGAFDYWAALMSETLDTIGAPRRVCCCAETKCLAPCSTAVTARPRGRRVLLTPDEQR